jgi:hypothetical protein
MKTRPSRPYFLLFFANLLLAAIPLQVARADVGPKSSMQFIFVSELDPQPGILSGQLLVCEDSACSRAEPLREMGPQGFNCQANTCTAIAYGDSPYYRP